MKVRTRMAPSPTGEFHIGGIRTVLYNFALARQNEGKFVLRVEDTDQKREVEGAVDRLLSVIKDYGLSWDEGPDIGGPFQPYKQSQRLPVYQKYAQDLVKAGGAYYCFCSQERLEEVRKSQQAAKLPVTKYDRHCRNTPEGEIEKNLQEKVPYVIRLKVPNLEVISFHDEILGDIKFNTDDVEDSILLKSDGYPTYHLAATVDDHLMEITHVFRGIEWLPSTPKHLLIYQILGWEVPKIAHLPNVKEIGASKKMSKRTGNVSAVSYLEEGYLVEAVLNFLMLLGWNPGTPKEIYSLDEFVNDFSIERIHKTDLIAFDREKLLWLNGYYIRNMPAELLMARILAWSSKFNVRLVSDVPGFAEGYALKCLKLVQERLKKLDEYNELVSIFFLDPVSVSGKDAAVLLKESEKYAGSLQQAISLKKGFGDLFSQVQYSDWNKENLQNLSHKYIEESAIKPKSAFMTLRILLTGVEATPPLFDVMELLGKDVVIERLGLYH